MVFRRVCVSGASRAAVLLFAAAALPRLAYLWVVRPGFLSEYWPLSSGLLRDGSLSLDGVKTADFEPLYPIFLAVCRVLTFDTPVLVQICQIAVSACGAVLLSRLAVELTGRQAVGTAAALLFAIDPLLIRQSVNASEGALVTTLLIAFALSSVRAASPAGWAVAGASLGLAALTRSMTLPVAAIVSAWLLVRRKPVEALALAGATLIAVSPYLARNYLVSGGLGATRAGLNLYIGNAPMTARLLPYYDLDLLVAEANDIIARELPDLEDARDPRSARKVDVLLTRRALRHMAEDVPGTAVQKLKNVAYFFWPVLVPFEVVGESTRIVAGPDGQAVVENSRRRPLIELVSYTTSYVPVLLLACAGVWFRRRALERDAVLWSIVATFVAVYVWYFPATRYRAPMSFVLLFYAAVAIDRGVSRLFRILLT